MPLELIPVDSQSPLTGNKLELIPAEEEQKKKRAALEAEMTAVKAEGKKTGLKSDAITIFDDFIATPAIDAGAWPFSVPRIAQDLIEKTGLPVGPKMPYISELVQPDSPAQKSFLSPEVISEGIKDIFREPLHKNRNLETTEDMTPEQRREMRAAQMLNQQVFGNIVARGGVIAEPKAPLDTLALTPEGIKNRFISGAADEVGHTIASFATPFNIGLLPVTGPAMATKAAVQTAAKVIFGLLGSDIASEGAKNVVEGVQEGSPEKIGAGAVQLPVGGTMVLPSFLNPKTQKTGAKPSEVPDAHVLERDIQQAEQAAKPQAPKQEVATKTITELWNENADLLKVANETKGEIGKAAKDLEKKAKALKELGIEIDPEQIAPEAVEIGTKKISQKLSEREATTNLAPEKTGEHIAPDFLATRPELTTAEKAQLDKLRSINVDELSKADKNTLLELEKIEKEAGTFFVEDKELLAAVKEHAPELLEKDRYAPGPGAAPVTDRQLMVNIRREMNQRFGQEWAPPHEAGFENKTFDAIKAEKAKRDAEFEAARAQKVAQDQALPEQPAQKPLTQNQLNITQESLRKEIEKNQITGRPPEGGKLYSNPIFEPGFWKLPIENMKKLVIDFLMSNKGTSGEKWKARELLNEINAEIKRQSGLKRMEPDAFNEQMRKMRETLGIKEEPPKQNLENQQPGVKEETHKTDDLGFENQSDTTKTTPVAGSSPTFDKSGQGQLLSDPFLVQSTVNAAKKLKEHFTKDDDSFGYKAVGAMNAPAEKLRLTPDKDGRYTTEQLVARLENILPPFETSIFKDTGVFDKIKAVGSKVSPDEVKRIISENAPKVEVHSYGMEGKVSEAKKEYDRMTHEWYDNLKPEHRDVVDIANPVLLDNPKGFFLHKDFTEKNATLAEKYIKLRNQIELNPEPHDTSPRATSAYDTVSALPTNEPMPDWTTSKEGKNVQRVDVVIPNKKSLTYDEYLKKNNLQHSDELMDRWHRPLNTPEGLRQKDTDPYPVLWQPDNLHENLPNTLGWAMIQYKTGAKGEKIAVIAEAQSRWGQTVREQQQKMAVKATLLKESQLGSNTYEVITKDGKTHKINGKSEQDAVNKYNNVEVRMGVPEHPLLRDYNRLILKAAIEQARKEGATHIMVSDAETAMMTEGHDLQRETVDVIDHLPTKAQAEKQMAKYKEHNPDKAYTIEKSDHSNEWVIREVEARPYQEPGMRLNYDTILQKIAEELTGVKGEKVSLGEHKNAMEDKEPREWDAENNRIQAPRQNLIFKNADGTPKTDVSGMMYSLENAVKEISKRGGMSITGKKLYSGIPFLDPDFIKSTLAPVAKGIANVVNRGTLKIAGTTERIEKMHGKEGEYIAPRFNDVAAERVNLYGKFVNGYVEAGEKLLSTPKEKLFGTSKQLDEAFQYMYDINDSGKSSITLNPEQKTFVDEVRRINKLVHEEQRRDGPLVGGTRTPISDPNWIFERIDNKVTDIITQRPTSKEAIDLKRDFVEYRMKQGYTEAAAMKEMSEMYARSGKRETPKFNALRKAEGLGVPPSWREKNFFRASTGYGQRAATDLAFYRHIEKDPTARAIMDLSNDNALKAAKTWDDGTPIQKLSTVDDIRSIMDELTNNFTREDTKLQATQKAVKAGWLQAPAGIRDAITAPFIAMESLHVSEIPKLFQALGYIGEGYRKGIEGGVIRKNQASVQEIFRGTDGFTDIVDSLVKGTTKISGREHLERLSRSYIRALGGLVAESRMAAGDTAFFDKFGMHGWADIAKTPEGRNKVIDWAADRFTENKQGTYDYRGLPSIAREGWPGALLSMSKWSIERFNNWRNNVMPELKKGNVEPLFMSMVGAATAGLLVQQFNSLVQKSKPQNMTVSEWMGLDDVDKDETALMLFSIANAGGFAGILSGISHDMLSATMGGQPLGYSIPVAQSIGDNSMDLFKWIQAKSNGEDPKFIDFIWERLKDNIQNIRAAANIAQGADERQLADMKRDYKLYKRDVDDVVPPMVAGNPYVGNQEQRFRQAKTQKEMEQILRDEILPKFEEQTKGSFMKMKEALEGLKQGNERIGPSLKTKESIEKAREYKNYIEKSQGAGARWNLNKEMEEEMRLDKIRNYLIDREIKKYKYSKVN